MIETTIFIRTFDRKHVVRLFDDADDRAVATHVAADRTWIFFRNIRTDRTGMHELMQLRDALRKKRRIASRLLEQIQREPLRRLAADRSQPREAFDESFECRGGIKHYN